VQVTFDQDDAQWLSIVSTALHRNYGLPQCSLYGSQKPKRGPGKERP
jgi:hypothetical protein